MAILLASSVGTVAADDASALAWGLHLPNQAVARRIAHGGVRVEHDKPMVLADLAGAGCIRRLWLTGVQPGRQYILRAWFDGAEVPQIEAPLSDFFGAMHNLAARDEPYRLNTPFLAIKPHNAFTCYLPMPFARSARIELLRQRHPQEIENADIVYCLIDWHEYPDQALTEPMRLCARWRRESPVRDYADDFIVLDADGPGRLVGIVYSVDMLQSRQQMRWSHAGADNLYIDGDGPQPAFLRGIGGEDTFGTSFGGNEYPAGTSLYSDMPYYVQKDPAGDQQKLVGYRFFLHDTVPFQKSLHVRFGARAHDIAATAYWYSAAPVRPYYRMPPVEQRWPGSTVRRGEYDLPLVNSGRWWVAGPFAAPGPADWPATSSFDPRESWHDKAWEAYDALRGFVDFNHRYRPEPTNRNSPTLVDVVAMARATLNVPRATTATLTLGWDDRLSLRVNDQPPLDLGEQSYLKARSIQVPLAPGTNTITVRLSNTTGMTRGAWNFSFRAVTADGQTLLPEAHTPAESIKEPK